MANPAKQTAPDAEGVSVCVFDDAAEVASAIAKRIADLIREKADSGRPCVLGLPAGSTPLGVYTELVRLHKQQGLSFANVVTFNLDEYYPMQPDKPQSRRQFMAENLFQHVDIDPAGVHLPDGSVAPQDVAAHCEAYERAIAEAGGIDLQLLGIGRTGHIGFNEPGSGRDSRTRLITLDRVTRLDVASDFFGVENVPLHGITMGVGTILRARSVILTALGEHKAPIIARAVEGPVTASVSASFLQEHGEAVFMLDTAAAAELTRVKCPWLLGPVKWDEAMVHKAAVWLARKLDKPILKLTAEDYNENQLQDLLVEHGSAYEINLEVFRAMQETITGWPGGKPADAKRPGDIQRPRDRIFPKRVLIFSPHPDDDVVCMGGTFIRLVEQGHEVHVAYQTSGSLSVFDHDAIRFGDFAVAFNRIFRIDEKETARIERHIERFLKNKKLGEAESPEVRRVKSLIRRGEARAAGRYCGVQLENLHFLDMPFYETGRVRKKQLGEGDIAAVAELLEEIRPQQIYAAGDLSDPHGTHRMCLDAVLQAIDRVKNSPWFADCEIWLYRGAWREWEPQQIDMAVPLSPDEVRRKRYAIFHHQSQKDRAMFPGAQDSREFWQRAEDRNRATAGLYDKLGLAEYEAIEGFARWRPSG
ncbi:MAG: glucosamine-6-phosphate deaminase [Planctomycetota bacterium]|jgi:glucosamine-6-phosphate deaminase